MGGKVFTLKCKIEECADNSLLLERQLELFRDDTMGLSQIVFVDVDCVDQDSLLTILAKNPICGILDIRPKPIFRRPKYEHVRVSAYIYNRNISYRECVLHLNGNDREITGESVIQGNPPCGITMCLFDSEARELGWLNLVRSFVRRKSLFNAELNPRGLLGFPNPHPASN